MVEREVTLLNRLPYYCAATSSHIVCALCSLLKPTKTDEDNKTLYTSQCHLSLKNTKATLYRFALYRVALLVTLIILAFTI